MSVLRKILNFKKPQEKPVEHKQQLFGIPLYQINNGKFPEFLNLAFDCIKKHGLLTEGIFRLSGTQDIVLEAKNMCETGKIEQAMKKWEDDPIIISSLIRMFFRELPEPLLTYSLYAEFVSCDEMETQKGKLTKLSQNIDSLPTLNKEVLSSLLEMLNMVSQKSEKNKMGSENLAIVFGASILKQRPEKESLEQLLKDAPSVTEVVKTMIEEYKVVFGYKELKSAPDFKTIRAGPEVKLLQQAGVLRTIISDLADGIVQFFLLLESQIRFLTKNELLALAEIVRLIKYGISKERPKLDEDLTFSSLIQKPLNTDLNKDQKNLVEKLSHATISTIYSITESIKNLGQQVSSADSIKDIVLIARKFKFVRAQIDIAFFKQEQDQILYDEMMNRAEGEEVGIESDNVPDIDYIASLEALTNDILTKLDKLLIRLNQCQSIEESLYISKLVLFLRKKIKEKSKNSTQLALPTTNSPIPCEQHLRLVVGVEHSIDEIGKLLDDDNQKAKDGILSAEQLLALLLFYLNVQKTLASQFST